MAKPIFPYQEKLALFNPKSAQEAYNILLRDDYAGEFQAPLTYMYSNQEIVYIPQTTLEKYSEFKSHNIIHSSLERKINRFVMNLRKDIKRYNKMVGKRAFYKEKIKNKIEDIVLIINEL